MSKTMKVLRDEMALKNFEPILVSDQPGYDRNKYSRDIFKSGFDVAVELMEAKVATLEKKLSFVKCCARSGESVTDEEIEAIK